MKASSDNPVNDNSKEDNFIRIYSSALFEDNERLIDTAIDELPTEAIYPHPLSDFYDTYSQELLSSKDYVFIPYEAAVPGQNVFSASL